MKDIPKNLDQKEIKKLIKFAKNEVKEWLSFVKKLEKKLIAVMGKK